MILLEHVALVDVAVFVAVVLHEPVVTDGVVVTVEVTDSAESLAPLILVELVEHMDVLVLVAAELQRTTLYLQSRPQSASNRWLR